MPPKLPPFLTPGHPFVDNDVHEDVQAATGGDLSRFRQTSVIVHGQTPRAIDDCLAQTAFGVKRLKIHSQSATARPDLDDVVIAAGSHGVDAYIGGGVMEDAIRGDRVGATVKEMQRLGIHTVELSDSEGDLRRRDLRDVIRRLRAEFDTLLLEIGPKSSGAVVTQQWIDDMKRALDAGADAVVLEGGGGGNCGVYDENGSARSLLVARLIQEAGPDAHKLLIEAARPTQQTLWTHGLGWDTPMGNVILDPSLLESLSRLRLAALRRDRRNEVIAARTALLSLLQGVSAAAAARGIPFDSLVNDINPSAIHVGDADAIDRVARELVTHIDSGRWRMSAQAQISSTIGAIMDLMGGRSPFGFRADGYDDDDDDER